MIFHFADKNENVDNTYSVFDFTPMQSLVTDPQLLSEIQCTRETVCYTSRLLCVRLKRHLLVTKLIA